MMMALCQCCPYGYHIDLDFVRYCETLALSVASEGERIRRDRWRQRKSMEVMLGFEHLQQQHHHRNNVLPPAVEESTSANDTGPSAAWTQDYGFYGNGTGGGTGRETWETSEFIRDVLEDVCDDFERTLEHSKSKKQQQQQQQQRQRDVRHATIELHSRHRHNDDESNRGNNQRQAANGSRTKATMLMPLCQCCPYGYHIDLDFVRYCETLAQSVASEGERIRRDRRRQRKSMEVMLGFEHLQQQHHHRNNVLPPAVEESTSANDTGPSAAWTQDYGFYGNGTGGGTGRETWETSEFIRDVLEDVCDDFERTLEHSKSKKQQQQQQQQQQRDVRHATIELHSRHRHNDDESNRGNNQRQDGCITSSHQHHRQRHDRTTDDRTAPYPHFGAIDVVPSRVRRRASEPVALDSPDDDRHSVDSRDDGLPHAGDVDEEEDISTGALLSIREQMAISLSRMRDLEEQVKMVPVLQQQLAAARHEKRQLQLNATNRMVESTATAPSNASQPFVAQRVNPIALEAMNRCLNNNNNNKSVNTTLASDTSASPVTSIVKRDVASMTTLAVCRDIGVSTNHVQLRSLGTQHNDAKMYTKEDLQAAIDVTIERQRRNLMAVPAIVQVSVGTQMQQQPPPPPPPPPKQLRNVLVQTAHQQSIRQRDAQVQSATPTVRSFGCSTIVHVPEPCAQCARTAAIAKRNIACGPETMPDPVAAKISLHALGMPPRSSTFCLGDNERLAIAARRSVATQSDQHRGQATTVGTQHSRPAVQSVHSQYTAVPARHQHTDTDGLSAAAAAAVRRQHRGCNTEPRLPMKSVGCSIEPALASTREQGCQSQVVQQRDIGCGNVTANRSHILIECADNYCDTCKDCIRRMARDFTKTSTTGVQAMAAVPVSQASSPTGDYSRIPRPMALASPRADRKFQRQNTYTLTRSGSSTTASTPVDVDDNGERMFFEVLQPLERTDENGGPVTERFGKDPFGGLEADSKIAEVAKSDELVDEPPSKQRNDADPVITRVHQNTGADRHNEKITKDNVEEREDEVEEEVEPAESTDRMTTNDADETSVATTESLCKEMENRLVMPAGPSRSDDLLLLARDAAAAAGPRTSKAEPNREMHAALKVISDALQKPTATVTNIKAASKIVQTEWFKVSSMEEAKPLDVDDFLDCFEEFSNQLLRFMVNLSDLNGNTAMHYAVSHGNFDVVSILLDSKVCDVNQTNNAGYTCVMLVSLAKLKISAHHTVVQRLFQMSDVNIRAKKHCQTALMLAVSHGNLDMVHMLLNAGADINIQDADGSTALMCAAEHGRIDIVKLLLAQPDCDSTIQDIDGSTALKISLEAGYRDIGVLLYAHEHITRNSRTSPYTSLRRKKKTLSGSSVASIGGGGVGAAATSSVTHTQSVSVPASPAPSKKFHHHQHHR